MAALVRLDGFHALKHAIRFGAAIDRAITDAPDKVIETARALSPDVVPWLEAHLQTVTSTELEASTEQLQSSRVVAFASRPPDAVPTQRSAPVVALEAPRHLSNLGATVRVAAAAGASAVATTGVSDPWHPVAVRTAAGLHFSLPVLRFETVADAAQAFGGPVVGIDPDGDDLRDADVPAGAVLCFGTERAGLTDEALAVCSARLRIPMRAGVSSLNLATSVAAVLYHLAMRTSRSESGLV